MLKRRILVFLFPVILILGLVVMLSGCTGTKDEAVNNPDYFYSQVNLGMEKSQVESTLGVKPEEKMEPIFTRMIKPVLAFRSVMMQVTWSRQKYCITIRIVRSWGLVMPVFQKIKWQASPKGCLMMRLNHCSDRKEQRLLKWPIPLIQITRS